MSKWFWLKLGFWKFAQLLLFLSLLLLEQFFGPLIFCLSLYFIFVGLKPNAFNFVFFTLSCSWLISLFTLTPWFLVTTILFLSLLLLTLCNKILKSFRLSLVLVTIVSAITLFFSTQIFISFSLVLKFLFSAVFLAIFFLNRRSIINSRYDWQIN